MSLHSMLWVMHVTRSHWTRGEIGRFGAALAIALVSSGCGEEVPPPRGADFPEDPDSLRFVQSGGEEGERLETSILSYEDARGWRVDLVSVVHIGERAYYEELNGRFESYDAVLYELVAEQGTRPVAGMESSGLISYFQGKLKDLLDLEFQLDLIDYSAGNLVHADVTPAEFDALFAERDDSLIACLFRAALKAQHPESGFQVSTFELFRVLFAEDHATELKRLLADLFEDVDKLVAGFNDETGTSVLVTDRNARAMEVLADQLAAGRKRLAIFYGAAHMEDFHERLVGEGFVGQSEEWLTAWSITPTPSHR